MIPLFAKWLLIGFFGGALFGIFFGTLAAFFHNGPTLAQGIAESWWWFAIIGTTMALGHARLESRNKSSLA